MFLITFAALSKKITKSQIFFLLTASLSLQDQGWEDKENYPPHSPTEPSFTHILQKIGDSKIYLNPQTSIWNSNILEFILEDRCCITNLFAAWFISAILNPSSVMLEHQCSIMNVTIIHSTPG